jgi:hypothetical protein
MPRGISFLPDGALGVGAARFDRFGTLAGDPDLLDAALVTGLPGGTSADDMGYRVLAAAWTPDGKRLWLGVAQRARRGQTGALPEPHLRTLLLDDRLALVSDLSPGEGTPWQTVLARGDAIATVGGPLTLWKASTQARSATLPGPPVAIALSADGARAATTDVDGVHVLAADGKELAHWRAGDPSAIAISGDGAWVATAEPERVRLWRVDGASAKQAAEAAVEGVGAAIAFSPDGRRLVVASSPPRVTVLEIAPAATAP